jgi:hypothetical protein
MFINHKFFNTKYIDSISKRKSPKKIFLGQGELKHTSSKVIITFYIYNTEKIHLKEEYKSLHKSLYPKLKYIKLNNSKTDINFKTNILKEFISLDKKGNIAKDIKGNEIVNYNRPFTIDEFLKSPIHSKVRTNIINSYSKIFSLKQTTFYDIYCSIIISIVDKLTIYLKILVQYYKYLTKLVNIKILNDIEKFSVFMNKVNNFYPYNYPDYIIYKNISEDKYKENLYKLRYLLTFNNIKFEKLFTIKLIHIIEKLYNKKIEFNIVNLEKIHLNSDILTQAIVLKLKNRKNTFSRVLRSVFNEIKLPRSTRLSDIGTSFMKKNNIDQFLVNKIRNSYFTEMLQDTNHKDYFNKLLFKIFPMVNHLSIRKKIYNKKTNTIFLYNYIFKHLKHFQLAGVRLEAKGRLTKRYTAARSIYDIKWKGGLKNVDSSFKGLSTIMIRGNIRSNVQYSMLKSKYRIGAFGIKGWVANK